MFHLSRFSPKKALMEFLQSWRARKQPPKNNIQHYHMHYYPLPLTLLGWTKAPDKRELDALYKYVLYVRAPMIINLIDIDRPIEQVFRQRVAYRVFRVRIHSLAWFAEISCRPIMVRHGRVVKIAFFAETVSLRTDGRITVTNSHLIPL